MLSFHYIVFPSKMGYFDSAEEYYKALWCKNQVSIVYVQYHLNCWHITDNSGDIKLWLMFLHLIWFDKSFVHLIWVLLITMKLIISLFFNNQVRKHCIFYITRIVGILLTVGVILNFDWSYQFTTSFFHLKWVILIRLKCIIRLFDARFKLVTLYVQYHLSCRHITDNWGDIKLWLMFLHPIWYDTSFVHLIWILLITMKWILSLSLQQQT